MPDVTVTTTCTSPQFVVAVEHTPWCAPGHNKVTQPLDPGQRLLAWTFQSGAGFTIDIVVSQEGQSDQTFHGDSDPMHNGTADHRFFTVF